MQLFAVIGIAHSQFSNKPGTGSDPYEEFALSYVGMVVTR